MVQQFREAGFMVDMKDDQSSTLNKKIRSAQLAQYNYIFGKDEKLKPLLFLPMNAPRCVCTSLILMLAFLAALFIY